MSNAERTKNLILRLRAGHRTTIVMRCGRTGTVRVYWCGDPTSISASGGGYDKFGSVLGDLLQHTLQEELRDYYAKNPGQFSPGTQGGSYLIGSGAMYGATKNGEKFSVGGAAGFSRMVGLAQALGVDCEHAGGLRGEIIVTLRRSKQYAQPLNAGQ